MPHFHHWILQREQNGTKFWKCISKDCPFPDGKYIQRPEDEAPPK